MDRKIKKTNHHNQDEVFWKGRILKMNIIGMYLGVELCKKAKRKSFHIHRLVGFTFLKNDKNLPQINHKDLNKLNNRVDNLEWCSVKDNILHANRNGHIANNRGEKHGMSKLTEKQVLEIRKRAKNETGYKLAKEFKISSSTVYDILNKRRWKWLK